MKTRTVHCPVGLITLLLDPCKEAPLYGVRTLRKRAHNSGLMNETLAPVSIRASMRTASTKTDTKFDGRSGGLERFAGDAVFPPNTALTSFPGGGRRRKTQGEEAVPYGDLVKASGLVVHGSCGERR